MTYTPPAPPLPTARTETFSYGLTDGRGLASASAATVTVTIPGQQQPPVALDDAFTVTEDVARTGNVLTAGAGDSDPNSDALTALLLTRPARGVVALSADGTFIHTPPQDYIGDGSNRDSFSHAVSDGAASDAGTATLTFTPVNDAPIAVSDALSVGGQAGATTVGNVLTLGVDTDVEGDALTVERLTDTDLGGVALTITPSNDPPVAIDDVFTTPAVGALSGNVLTVSNVTLTIEAPTLENPTLPFTVEGAVLRFDPIALDTLDTNQTATLRFSYTVSDGVQSVSNQVVVTVVGLGTGVGRVAGQYADTLTGRYNNHFDPNTVQDASCLNCHNPGCVDVRVLTVADCQNVDLNTFGLALCLDREPEPLVDLLRRLQAQGARFAPKLTSAPALRVRDDSAVGAPLGAPLSQVTDPGLTVDGAPAQIHSYLIADGGGFGATDATGQFSVEATGQLRVAGALAVGVYTLDVRPVNDAGRKNNAGAVVSGRPGYIPLEQALLRFVTVTLVGAVPTAVADAANTAAG